MLPNIEGFKFKVRTKYQVEKYISTKNNKLETFYEKWPKDISPFNQFREYVINIVIFHVCLCFCVISECTVNIKC